MTRIKLIILLAVILTLCAGCSRSADNKDKDITVREHRYNTTLVDSHEVNVLDCGATGDDDTDDTAAIQKAADDVYAAGGGRVLVPDGVYIIDAVKSIRLNSNTQLQLSPQAVLQAAPNNNANYALIRIFDADNVEVVGGKIIGERNYHTGESGEWGHGISVLGSSAVRIADIAISDCWGDGIYIGSSEEQNFCGDVIIEEFEIRNCRRNGITVISGRLVTIRDGMISDTDGTDPQSAICLEPNSIDEYLEDILIDNVQANNSTKYGLLFGLGRYVDTSHNVSVILRDFTSVNHGQAAFNDFSSFDLPQSQLSINIL